MDKLDPPIQVAEPKTEEHIQYMREKIFVLPEYETNFPPVSGLHFGVCVCVCSFELEFASFFRNFTAVQKNSGQTKACRSVLLVPMNTS